MSEKNVAPAGTADYAEFGRRVLEECREKNAAQIQFCGREGICKLEHYGQHRCAQDCDIGDNVRPDPAPVEAGYIITSPKGGVIHMSERDGWKVEKVIGGKEGETPESDKAALYYNDENLEGSWVVHREVARALERRCNAAERERDALKPMLEAIQQASHILVEERDALTRERDYWKRTAHEECNAKGDAREALDTEREEMLGRLEQATERVRRNAEREGAALTRAEAAEARVPELKADVAKVIRARNQWEAACQSAEAEAAGLRKLLKEVWKLVDNSRMVDQMHADLPDDWQLRADAALKEDK